MSDLIKSIGMAISLKVLGAGLAFLLTLVVGRMMGANGAGLYFLTLSITSIVGVIARLGLENTVIRFVSYFQENNDWGQLRGVVSYALIWVASVSFTFSIIIFLFANQIERYVFNLNGMASVLMGAAFSVLFFNLMAIFSAVLKGLGMSSKATLVESVLYPFCALVLVYPLISICGMAGASIAYMAGTIFASLVGLIVWRSAISGRPPTSRVNRNELSASSRPLWLSMTIIQAQPWIPILLLGIWATPSDAGVLGVASRSALLISLILSAINTVLAPRLTVLFKQDQIAQIENLACKCALFATSLSAPFLITFIFFGDLVMSIFGIDFSSAGNILAILALGQFVNAFTGPAGAILMMGGREEDIRTLSLISVSVVILLAMILIQSHGVKGAAIATSAGFISMNLFSVFMVRLRFKIWIFPYFSNFREFNRKNV